MQNFIHSVESGFENLLGGEEHSHTHHGAQCTAAHSEEHNNNRYQSFAPQTTGSAKWYVDGCSYFWAVSEALEKAQSSIYILDWWLSPELYLRRPPAQNEDYRLDVMLQRAAERGVQVRIIVYKEVPQALTLNSEHTKHALEILHPNIRVFRHPDHMPSGHDLEADLQSAFSNLRFGGIGLSKLGKDALMTLYGTSDDVVLYWAHHEKLCVIDDELVFMGGLDMCYGRWDTNTHPIADAHPDSPEATVFPGQDYNNARIYDFQDVDKWQDNKLDRNLFSRMGWSDISISLTGPIVSSLVTHFIDRWNYIFGQKYVTREKEGYAKITTGAQPHTVPEGLYGNGEQLLSGGYHFAGSLERRLNWLLGGNSEDAAASPDGGLHIQLTRSCTRWSSGHPTEHSIANAYISAITSAEHFVYMENQFFITATCDDQKPVANKVGRAIVDRIVRAHENGEDFGMIVCIPAVPGFAGDLHSDGALGTRAIMEFQYNSISRGGHSIYEELRKAGVDDPERYLRFYNLRNYDRINTPALQAGTDTVSACYMGDGRRLNHDDGTADPDVELNSYVSEELYIHSKVLVADDRLVICGSANMNDRSQLGTHDSEIAVVIEDKDHPIETTMAGKPFVAGGFAASLRRQLFRKHLGLLPDQRYDEPTDNFHPVNVTPNAYDWGSEEDRLVADPLSDEFRELWTGTAKTNTAAFDDVFHCVPTDRVRSWDDYKVYFSDCFVIPGVKEDDKSDKSEKSDKEDEEGEEKSRWHRHDDDEKNDENDDDGKKKRWHHHSDDEKDLPDTLPEGKTYYGHVVPGFRGGVEAVKERLAEIRGTLVEMPLQFLVDVKDLAKEGLTLNDLTDDLYT